MKKLLFALLAMVVMMFAPVPANAAQTIPNWCYEYPVIDSFNSWGNWGLWNVSNTGVTLIKTTGSAKTAPGAVLMSFARDEPNGDFMALDRYISMTAETTNTFSKCGGAAPKQPPSSKAKFCAANVYARTPQGTHLVLQMLDPDSYVIMTQADVNLPVSSNWTLISTPLTYNCRTDVVMRLALVKSSTSFSVSFDDFTVLWYY